MKTPTPQPGYLRPASAASYLDISTRHLRALTKRGAVPVIRLGKRCALYARSDLDKAMLKFRVSAVGGA